MGEDIKDILNWAWTGFLALFAWGWKIRAEDKRQLKEENDKLWTALYSKAEKSDMDWQRDNIKTLFQKQESLKDKMDTDTNKIISLINEKHEETMAMKSDIMVALANKQDRS